MTQASSHILLVEDNAFDAKVFCRSLHEAKLESPVTVVRDGMEALAVLRTHAKAWGEELIVVTDLNMPRMKGIDLLRALRSDAELTHLPVFIVTTSDARSDREKAFELGIEGYICKTDDGSDVLKPIIAYLAGRGMDL
jgi:CheY-like chemotaxis protein